MNGIHVMPNDGLADVLKQMAHGGLDGIDDDDVRFVIVDFPLEPIEVANIPAAGGLGHTPDPEVAFQGRVIAAAHFMEVVTDPFCRHVRADIEAPQVVLLAGQANDGTLLLTTEIDERGEGEEGFGGSTVSANQG